MSKLAFLIPDKKSTTNSLALVNVSLCLKYLVEAVDRFYVASTVYGLRKLPWLRSCSSPVLLLIAKGKLVSNHSMKLNRKILQPHLFCGVLYAYIRSDFWWSTWIWLYSSELYIIFRLWRDCRFAHYLSLMLCVYIETNHFACSLPESIPSRWTLILVHVVFGSEAQHYDRYSTTKVVFTDLWYEADNQLTCVGGMRVSA